MFQYKRFQLNRYFTAKKMRDWNWRFYFTSIDTVFQGKLYYLTNVQILTLQSSTSFHCNNIPFLLAYGVNIFHFIRYARLRTVQSETNYLQKSWCYKFIMNILHILVMMLLFLFVTQQFVLYFAYVMYIFLAIFDKYQHFVSDRVSCLFIA
jgi:hypothetical protein